MGLLLAIEEAPTGLAGLPANRYGYDAIERIDRIWLKEDLKQSERRRNKKEKKPFIYSSEWLSDSSLLPLQT